MSTVQWNSLFKIYCVLLAICWSSLFNKLHKDPVTELSEHSLYSVLAVALKDGRIALWTVNCPATDAR